MKMGYDDCECFECYNGSGGNNPCRDDGSYHETCLKCIHEICDNNATNRVINALQHGFEWNCNSRCTRCDTVGITIEILLCNYHSEQRHSDEPNVEYECFLCDYEGECRYDENHILLNDFVCCTTCENELQSQFTERTRGSPKIWDGNGYTGTCSRCKSVSIGVEELPVCNHHIELIR